jgi:crotonobetainyl-CoA:carnitine CoA-transferase CaiB-like acyl-CoA transferase
MQIQCDDRRRIERNQNILLLSRLAHDERRLLTHLEDKHLEDDPRFRDIAARTSNVDTVLSYLSKVLTERTTSEWLRVFDQLDIPCAALNTLDSLIDAPHLNAVGFFKLIEHRTEGSIRSTVVPANWSQTPPGPSRECARLGEHTEEILEQLEYSPLEIRELARQEVIRGTTSARKAS